MANTTLPISVVAINHVRLTTENIDVNLHGFFNEMSVNQQEYTPNEKCEFAAYIRKKMGNLPIYSDNRANVLTPQFRIFNGNKLKDKPNRNEYLAITPVDDENNVVFCVTCVLFGRGNGAMRTTGIRIGSYCEVNKTITSHEKSKAHMNAYIQYSEFNERKKCMYLLYF